MKALLSTSTAFRALTQEQCKALLEKHHVGRIAAGLEGWPAIVPVNYVFDGKHVVIRSGDGAKIDEIPMTAVAFEIDDWDPAGEWGWSVLLQGPAFDITNLEDETSVRMRALAVEPFAPGRRVNWLRLDAIRISGRAFGVCDV